MRLRKLLTYIPCALTAALFNVAPIAAAATECPIKIDQFFLNSAGATGKFYQYQINLTTNNPATVSVRFRPIAGSTNDGVVYASIPSSPGQQKLIMLFAWPSAQLTQIAVQDLAALEASPVPCESPAGLRSNKGLSQTKWRFDDSGMTAASSATAAVMIFSDPGYLKKVAPKYPESALERGIGGTATIAVIVGPGGRPLASWTVKSSGSIVLDDAGRQAAEASIFREPLVDGKPAAVTFLIDYIWKPD